MILKEATVYNGAKLLLEDTSHGYFDDGGQKYSNTCDNTITLDGKIIFSERIFSVGNFSYSQNKNLGEYLIKLLDETMEYAFDYFAHMFQNGLPRYNNDLAFVMPRTFICPTNLSDLLSQLNADAEYIFSGYLESILSSFAPADHLVWANDVSTWGKSIKFLQSNLNMPTENITQLQIDFCLNRLASQYPVEYMDVLKLVLRNNILQRAEKCSDHLLMSKLMYLDARDGIGLSHKNLPNVPLKEFELTNKEKDKFTKRIEALFLVRIEAKKFQSSEYDYPLPYDADEEEILDYYMSDSKMFIPVNIVSTKLPLSTKQLQDYINSLTPQEYYTIRDSFQWRSVGAKTIIRLCNNLLEKKKNDENIIFSKKEVQKFKYELSEWFNKQYSSQTYTTGQIKHILGRAMGPQGIKNFQPGISFLMDYHKNLDNMIDEDSKDPSLYASRIAFATYKSYRWCRGGNTVAQLVLEDLRKQMPLEALMQAITSVAINDVPLTEPQWQKYVENYETYVNMPASWVIPLLKTR